MSPEFIMTMNLLNEFRQVWLDKMKGRGEGVSESVYSRLSLVALTQLSAIIGVDIGMNASQFTAVCRANFDAAYERAPKFG